MPETPKKSLLYHFFKINSIILQGKVNKRTNDLIKILESVYKSLVQFIISAKSHHRHTSLRNYKSSSNTGQTKAAGEESPGFTGQDAG